MHSAMAPIFSRSKDWRRVAARKGRLASTVLAVASFLAWWLWASSLEPFGFIEDVAFGLA